MGRAECAVIRFTPLAAVRESQRRRWRSTGGNLKSFQSEGKLHAEGKRPEAKQKLRYLDN
jgi:hypothetical protein